MPVTNPDEFRRSLNRMSDHQIREAIKGPGWDAAKGKFAEEVLHEREAARQKAIHAEALKKAELANVIAAVALVVSIVALVISAK
jgi:hypothetical protein